MSTTIAGLSYLGVDTYWETDASDLDVDDYGLDTLTRTYHVRPDFLASFLLLFPRGTQDSALSWLYSVSRKMSHIRGPLIEARVTFKGLQEVVAGRTLYHEMQKGGVAKAQVTIASNDGKSQRTLDYRGPWTEWRYISTVQPDQPRHRGEMITTKLNFTMLSSTGGLGTLFVNPTPLVPPEKAPDANLLYTFNALVVIQNSAFEFEESVKPKAGSSGATSVWTVLERNEARIIDYTQYFISQFLSRLGGTPQ